LNCRERFGFQGEKFFSFSNQGCQMAHFQTKIPIWVKSLAMDRFGSIRGNLDILWSFGTYMYLLVFLVHFSCFGILCQEKSVNPAPFAASFPTG
jgi:hypothetical protein